MNPEIVKNPDSHILDFVKDSNIVALTLKNAFLIEESSVWIADTEEMLPVTYPTKTMIQSGTGMMQKACTVGHRSIGLAA